MTSGGPPPDAPGAVHMRRQVRAPARLRRSR